MVCGHIVNFVKSIDIIRSFIFSNSFKFFIKSGTLEGK
jgi:hypothetical protein